MDWREVLKGAGFIIIVVVIASLLPYACIANQHYISKFDRYLEQNND